MRILNRILIFKKLPQNYYFILISKQKFWGYLKRPVQILSTPGIEIIPVVLQIHCFLRDGRPCTSHYTGNASPFYISWDGGHQGQFR